LLALVRREFRDAVPVVVMRRVKPCDVFERRTVK